MSGVVTSSPLSATEPHRRLAEHAVTLLTSSDARGHAVDLRVAARRAIELRLAGLFRMGLGGSAGAAATGTVVADLQRAERREVAADLSAARRTQEVLDALRVAGVGPVVVLKGRSLAERLWPRPWMRPSGDLDLLVSEQMLAKALAALVRIGLRPRGDGTSGRWRPTLAGVVLTRAANEDGVDLHTRPFRSVGSGLETAGVLTRAREAELLGCRVSILDPADEILFLLVHAAAHGTIHPKWLLDLEAAASAYPRSAWQAAAERARTTRTTRAFWAAARLLRGPEAAGARELARRLRPPPHVRPFLERLVVTRLAPPWPTRQRLRGYALEGLLEERLRARVVRIGGLLERLAGRLARGLWRVETGPSRAEVASGRWIERGWRAGCSAPVWLTLRGGSMAPALHEGDRLLVTPFQPGEAPREGDVVIAKRAGRLVAHRLIARTAQGLLTRGDACLRDDPPVARDEILAKVVAIDANPLAR